MSTAWGWLDGFRAALFTGVIALIVTLLATPVVRRVAIRYGAVDDPKSDDRRIHTEPIPRWGGIGIFAGIVVALGIVLPLTHPIKPFPPYLIAVAIACFVLIVWGALDDLYKYSAKLQLLVLLALGLGVQFFYDPIGRVQIQGISIPFVNGGEWIAFGWLAIPFTMIYLFVLTKTMDTIDGVDGLSSGIAAIAAVTLCIIAAYEGQPRVALIAAAIAGACVGFLRYNYNPAKIFMGTGGAQLLGFLLAALSIVGAIKTAAAFAILIPILVFGVPIFDAIFVVVRRIMSGSPVTQADKRHLHHTLLSKGLNQRQTVWVLYAVAAALAGTLLVVRSVYG